MTPKGKIITENCETQRHKTFYLEEGNYVTGYYATLVYVMKGLVKAVYVLETFHKKKLEILSKTCKLESVPIFVVQSSDEELKDVEVFAVIDKP